MEHNFFSLFIKNLRLETRRYYVPVWRLARARKYEFMSHCILVMGVSGCGKTTIGQQLAEQLKVPFLEGDDFHPVTNISKMKSGQSLNDDDRLPWLKNLAKAAKENESLIH